MTIHKKKLMKIKNKLHHKNEKSDPIHLFKTLKFGKRNKDYHKKPMFLQYLEVMKI